MKGIKSKRLAKSFELASPRLSIRSILLSPPASLGISWKLSRATTYTSSKVGGTMEIASQFFSSCPIGQFLAEISGAIIMFLAFAGFEQLLHRFEKQSNIDSNQRLRLTIAAISIISALAFIDFFIRYTLGFSLKETILSFCGWLLDSLIE